VPADHRPARRDRLLDLVRQRDLDGLVVHHLPNVHYLTGFTGSSGVVAMLPEETVLLTDFRYRTQAEEEAGDAARVEVVARDLWERLWQVLRDRPTVDRLGFEAHTVSVEDAERFAEAELPITFVPERRLVEQLRARKDPDEVAAIRAAADLARTALETTLETVRIGQRELDVAVVLEAELRRRGSEWHPFPTIAASGPRSALPHATTGERELRRGEWLLLDFGARVDGYCADITRTVLVGGSPDERQQLIYELVRDAQLAARRGLRSGMTGRDADEIARSLIERRGFGDAFGHSLGHGIGLEVHEDPRVSRANEAALPDGAVVTVEPGVYLPGWGGVRIEDDVLLTADGAELLSDGETELRVVG
jgi:Xaa-Pro aminopeptidase